MAQMDTSLNSPRLPLRSDVVAGGSQVCEGRRPGKAFALSHLADAKFKFEPVSGKRLQYLCVGMP